MRSVLSSLIAITAASALSATEPPQYDLVDIGSLNGFSTFATDVNARGVVVGYSQLGDAPPHSEPAAHAFLYQNGALTDLFDGSSVTVSIATAVNDVNHVVGFLREDALGPSQPWLDAGAGVVILDPFDVGLPFAITGSANGVNQSGQIAGSASGRAFLLTPPDTTDDLTPGPPAPYFGSSASALNDAAQVVGLLSKPGTWPLLDTADSFLYDGSSLVNLDEILNGQYPDANFVPSAISEAGVAVGYAYGPSLAVSAVTYESGFFAVLPSLGGDRGRAHDIDSVGRVVGDSTLPGDSSPRAVLWDGGEAYDLNDYVPAGGGMVLAIATAINDQGQIVVQGHAASDPYPPTTWHSFLLTPLDASNALEELIDIIEKMGLHHGIENSLIVKLEHALADVLAGDDAGACDHLSSFANQVEAQSGKKIYIADATLLLEEAASIQSSLGCIPWREKLLRPGSLRRDSWARRAVGSRARSHTLQFSSPEVWRSDTRARPTDCLFSRKACRNALCSGVRMTCGLWGWAADGRGTRPRQATFEQLATGLIRPASQRVRRRRAPTVSKSPRPIRVMLPGSGT